MRPEPPGERKATAIVPTSRLIFFAGLVVPPFAVLAAVWPPATFITALLSGAMVAVALFDAWRSPTGLRELRVGGPEFVRLHKNRPGTVELYFLRSSQRTQQIRAGCVFPESFAVVEEIQTIELPANIELARIPWPCTPSERGLYKLDLLALECGSPLGLWRWRERRRVNIELRVYPDLAAERQRVAALFLRRGMLGTHTQRRAGQGREFEKLREYLPGDSLADVHWKASAKRGQLVTKLHQLERSHEVYVVIDASRLSARPAGDDPSISTLERYVTAALILGASAERQGDQFGLITFSDRVLTFMRARNGQGHFNACRDRLYTLQPQPVTPDFEDLCALIRSRLSKRALLIFLTALDDPFLAESFVSSTAILARQHLMFADMMRPRQVRPMFENAAVTRVDDLYRELGAHLQWEKLRELERVLRRRGIRFHLLDPQMIAAELVKQHAEVRQRGLL